MKKIKGRALAAALTAVMLFFGAYSAESFAMNAKAVITPPGNVSVGETVSVVFSIRSDGAMTCMGEISVTGGGTLVSITLSPGEADGNRFLYSGTSGASAVQGTADIRVDSPEEVRMTLKGDAASLEDASLGEDSEFETTVYFTPGSGKPGETEEVTTEDEESRKASEKEAQESIDESIREKASSIQEEEGSIEEASNAAVASSCSEAEAKRLSEAGYEVRTYGEEERIPKDMAGNTSENGMTDDEVSEGEADSQKESGASGASEGTNREIAGNGSEEEASSGSTNQGETEAGVKNTLNVPLLIVLSVFLLLAIAFVIFVWIKKPFSGKKAADKENEAAPVQDSTVRPQPRNIHHLRPDIDTEDLHGLPDPGRKKIKGSED